MSEAPVRESHRVPAKSSDVEVARSEGGAEQGVLGGSLAALQQMLGHSSIVTTQRYRRTSADQLRREVERVEHRPRISAAEGVAR